MLGQSIVCADKRVRGYPGKDGSVLRKAHANVVRHDRINDICLQPIQKLKLFTFEKLNLDIHAFGKASEEFGHEQCAERFKTADAKDRRHSLGVPIHRPLELSLRSQEASC